MSGVRSATSLPRLLVEDLVVGLRVVAAIGPVARALGLVQRARALEVGGHARRRPGCSMMSRSTGSPPLTLKLVGAASWDARPACSSSSSATASLSEVWLLFDRTTRSRDAQMVLAVHVPVEADQPREPLGLVGGGRSHPKPDDAPARAAGAVTSGPGSQGPRSALAWGRGKPRTPEARGRRGRPGRSCP